MLRGSRSGRRLNDGYKTPSYAPLTRLQDIVLVVSIQSSRILKFAGWRQDERKPVWLLLLLFRILFVVHNRLCLRKRPHTGLLSNRSINDIRVLRWRKMACAVSSLASSCCTFPTRGETSILYTSRWHPYFQDSNNSYRRPLSVVYQWLSLKLFLLLLLF